MPDNRDIRDGNNILFIGASRELSDTAFAPKVALLDGGTSPTPISPATSALQTALNDKLPAALTAGGNLKVAVQEGGVAPKPATATRSNVAGSGTSVTVLAANTARLGASVHNDSTAILYLGLGAAAASTTSHSVQMPAGAHYEVPFGFTGQLTGIWASATGSARVTELT